MPAGHFALNQARESAEKIIDALHTPGEAKPRTYRKAAHKEYLMVARGRKRSRAFVRKSIRKQLGYLSRDLAHIDAILAGGKPLDGKLVARLETIQKVVQQQKSMYNSATQSVDKRIVSLIRQFHRLITIGSSVYA